MAAAIQQSAAEVVFMNDDKTDDPWELMRSCLERGPRLAVCTRGAQGAVALEIDGTLRGATVGDALKAAAIQATIAIESEHLHPVLGRDPALGD